ncbi:TRBP2 protein, partial [Cochlearius cochlearius]|nr:TRBP2 protein [Cochlearius cochlearius]
SLEQMLAANPGKTPISLLQEYGTRIGKTPGYDLLKAEGQAHQPNFTFRVTRGAPRCQGWAGGAPIPPKPSAPGTSLHLLTSPTWGSWRGGGLRAGPALRAPLTLRPSAPRRGTPLEMKTPGSFPHFGGVSMGLPSPAPPICHPCPPQELVVQKGWRLPEYTVTQESGPAHRKEFTMTCRVERFVEIGSGTSKKLAKRNAAAKMLVRIHNVPMEPREGSEAEVEEDQFSMAGPRLEGLRGRAPGCTWDSLRNSAGEKIVQLR